MLSALHSTRRFVAGLAACAFVIQLSAVAATAAALPVATQSDGEEITLTRHAADDRLLAHHGGEGSETAGVLGASAAAPALGMLTAHASKKSYSDSLWGNMLLNMAFSRDAELQKYAKRIGLVNNLTMLSVLSVTGLSLAQSIQSYNFQPEPVTVDVTPSHHPGGRDHVHMPPEQVNRTPSAMGIIGSGVTLGALGMRAVVGKVYTHKLVNRQGEIRDQIDSILNRLEEGILMSAIQPELVALVGERAGSEFLLLWKAVHPNAL